MPYFIFIVCIYKILNIYFFYYLFKNFRKIIQNQINNYKKINIINIDSIAKNIPVKSGDTTCVFPDTIYIPFINKNGHMDMSITIGNNTFTGLYDTGFDGYLSVDYATYYKLVGSGIIQENVFVDSLNYIIGDGSTCSQKVFIIPQVKIGDFVMCDVTAGLYNGNGINEIIIGNRMLSQFKSYSIDQEKQQIIIYKK